MKENLIEPARVRAIQEALCGFLLDEVINPNGEFHSDPRISVARADKLNKRRKKDAGAMQMIRIIEEFVGKNL